MSDEETIEAGGVTFRVMPMTLNRHSALAEVRGDLMSSQVEDAELMLRVDVLRRKMEGALTPEGEPDEEKLHDLGQQMLALNRKREATVAEITRCHMRCIAACVDPASGNGDGPYDVEWWAGNYDLRRLEGDWSTLGLVRPTSLTPD